MLLTPQHFQQLAARAETQMQDLPGRYVPFYWGVRRFEYDTGQLSGGVLTVLALDAVMRDGCAVQLAPERDALQLDLRPLAGRMRQAPLLVYLAMPLPVGHVPGAQQRFTSYAGDPVVDDNTGEGSVSIPRLRPNLSLIAGAEPPARFISFPLIEVRCEGELFVATPAFIPPALTVATSSTLGKLCAGICDRLRAKAAVLAEKAMLAPQSAAGTEARGQLACLVSELPAFEALQRTEAHPFLLYLELCRVAGQVAVLGRSALPPVFAAYAHDDIARSVEPLVQFILRSIDEGVPDTVRRFTFLQEGDTFRLPADPAWSAAFAWRSLARAVLAVRCDAAVEDAVAWGDNCVIGGASGIKSLLARRILGFARQHADTIGELQPPRGAFLFELTPDEEVFTPGDDLLVLQSTAGVRPEALYLYLVDPQPAAV
jgi:type VI secretion system protein ImpJ